MKLYSCAVLCSLLLQQVGVMAQGYYEGDSCTKDGVIGECKKFMQCPSAYQDLLNRKKIINCSFLDAEPVVCCVGSPPASTTTTTTTRRPAATTTTAKPTRKTTTQSFEEYEIYTERTAVCPPLDTANKTGQKAWDKCLEYQDKLVYPCERLQSLAGGWGRGKHCHHKLDSLIIGGDDAEPNEFPHMVLLGYGPSRQTAEWQCGGTLISENFILTAGHCVSDRSQGKVKYAAIRTLKRSQLDPNNIYNIKSVRRHPSYKPPNKYHDIALLETETMMKLDEYAVPACLHTGEAVNDAVVRATGWGLVEVGGASADTLQKVLLNKFTADECSETYQESRLMDHGFDSNTQTCYGDKEASKDTCQGDSGGPLVVQSRYMRCMYTVLGVTSFGKGCGHIGTPAIYTRVSYYTPWIESIVWP